MCNDSLGLGNRQIIADSRITASSNILNGKASNVRLNALSPGWIPSLTDRSPYIEISFSPSVIISAVATQGIDEAVDRWVTQYGLFYKIPGGTGLTPYQRNGQKVVSVVPCARYGLDLLSQMCTSRHFLATQIHRKLLSTNWYLQ